MFPSLNWTFRDGLVSRVPPFNLEIYIQPSLAVIYNSIFHDDESIDIFSIAAASEKAQKSASTLHTDIICVGLTSSATFPRCFSMEGGGGVGVMFLA